MVNLSNLAYTKNKGYIDKNSSPMHVSPHPSIIAQINYLNSKVSLISDLQNRIYELEHKLAILTAPVPTPSASVTPMHVDDKLRSYKSNLKKYRS
mgnify:CR=1 FL=1